MHSLHVPSLPSCYVWEDLSVYAYMYIVCYTYTTVKLIAQKHVEELYKQDTRVNFGVTQLHLVLKLNIYLSWVDLAAQVYTLCLCYTNLNSVLYPVVGKHYE